MNPNGFVAAASDDLPDVDVHPVAELRELVDERDVDRAEDVLEQLRQLGGLGRRDGVDRVDRARGRPRRRPRCEAVVDPAEDLRRRLRRPVGAARGRRAPARTRGWKSSPATRPLPCSRIGLRISRVVPGYVVDSSTTTWPARRCGASLRAGLLDVREVGLALLRERRRDARSGSRRRRGPRRSRCVARDRARLDERRGGAPWGRPRCGSRRGSAPSTTLGRRRRRAAPSARPRRTSARAAGRRSRRR